MRCPNDQAAESNGLKPLNNHVLIGLARGSCDANPELDLARRTWQMSKTWQILHFHNEAAMCLRFWMRFRRKKRYRILPQKWYGMVTS
jgi:hypothetical protein